MKEFMRAEIARINQHFNLQDRRQAMPPVSVVIAFAAALAVAVMTGSVPS